MTRIFKNSMGILMNDIKLCNPYFQNFQIGAMKIWKPVYGQVIQQVHNTSQLPQPDLYIKIHCSARLTFHRGKIIKTKIKVTTKLNLEL